MMKTTKTIEDTCSIGRATVRVQRSSVINCISENIDRDTVPNKSFTSTTSSSPSPSPYKTLSKWSDKKFVRKTPHTYVIRTTRSRIQTNDRVLDTIPCTKIRSSLKTRKILRILDALKSRNTRKSRATLTSALSPPPANRGMNQASKMDEPTQTASKIFHGSVWKRNRKPQILQMSSTLNNVVKRCSMTTSVSSENALSASIPIVIALQKIMIPNRYSNACMCMILSIGWHQRSQALETPGTA
mmetsp:Transcript_27469/g.62205  ORF Transcript_27469/g.62205 Transcript_27469/m.62205 type:complete len:243 (-) Transcript_27469:656-1384(-)